MKKAFCLGIPRKSLSERGLSGKTKGERVGNSYSSDPLKLVDHLEIVRERRLIRTREAFSLQCEDNSDPTEEMKEDGVGDSLLLTALLTYISTLREAYEGRNCPSRQCFPQESLGRVALKEACRRGKASKLGSQKLRIPQDYCR